MSTSTRRARGGPPVALSADAGVRPRRRWLAFGTAVLALAAGGAVFALRADDAPANDRTAANGPPPAASAAPSPSGSGVPATPGEVWRDGILTDYRPLAGASFSAVRTIVEWDEGRATPKDVAARIDVALPEIADTQKTLATRTPFSSAPAALVHYRAAADLYLQSMLLVRTATAIPAGPAQDQLRKAGARTRDLGDRAFDQAAVALAPYVRPTPQIDGVEVRKPAEVPDYSALDIGVGPPLEPVRPTPGTVRAYQSSRPTQSSDSWREAAEGIDIPADAQVTAALQSGDGSSLASIARRLVTASNALHQLPDPRDGRAVSTRVQLSLLVQSESARAAQLATILNGVDRKTLRVIAIGLATAGDALWDPVLGERVTAAGVTV